MALALTVTKRDSCIGGNRRAQDGGSQNES
jgi:hypothetical protein